MSTTDLLTTGDVAKALGVSRQHVVNMCERGDIECVRIGSHRRVSTSEVDRLRGTRLTREQEKSLWLHRALMTYLMTDPQAVLETARRNIIRWKVEQRPDGMTHHYLTRWEQVLASGLDHVVETITSESPEACELRQNTPFTGVIPDDVRLKILRSFNEHWKREHEDALVS